ncbi:unnamed protein product [Gongylonema pulchrum]|uniref:Protein kinase domain-containing protein n=1 Tax=Gongylonema pulchrum TaxID=637853 RepID=A0A183DJ26_9BILA|nr:unnamed protein product [Gongylonema pulchrum]
MGVSYQRTMLMRKKMLFGWFPNSCRACVSKKHKTNSRNSVDCYSVMRACWSQKPSKRPDFGSIRQKLASQLEDITDQYSYLKLDSRRDYYNVVYDTNDMVCRVL